LAYDDAPHHPTSNAGDLARARRTPDCARPNLLAKSNSRGMMPPMSAISSQPTPLDYSDARRHPSLRVESVDVLRGLVMFTMIFVNDLAHPGHVPAWMKHFRGYSGMTFVDLVFPAFQFIVGMSIPLALGTRLQRGEPVWRALGHVLLRTTALLAIGIMMVNSDLGPNSALMGWSGTWWTALMYTSAIAMCCSMSPGGRDAPQERRQFWRRVTLAIRVLGVAGMILLAMTYRASNGRPVLQLHPFFIRHAWYGILGVIGWGYLVASVVYLVFRNNRVALLACTALTMSLYCAGDVFSRSWIAHHVNIPSALGSHAALSVAGVLLASILVTPDTASWGSRVRFTALFVAGCVAAAILLSPQWGISKERATPAWCFWACAITAALWLAFYVIDETSTGKPLLKPLAVAGRNVLLAYLLSEMLESVFELSHLSGWYARLANLSLGHAIGRSALCSAAILSVTALLNRLGFTLRI
jgi:heparan-alpha-glucosaminide N-acetyltransferase